MVTDAAVADRLGLQPRTGDDLPLVFLRWARDFVKLERRLGWL